MILAEDEQKRIELIKRDFNTRNKWSKQDYSDFYFRDVGLLLGIVDRLAPQQIAEPDRDKNVLKQR